MVEGLAPVFRRKRILVTGHTGFKGAWLVQWLAALGAEVTGIALPGAVSEPNFFTRRGSPRAAMTSDSTSATPPK